jgi:hypothetical protein
MMNVDQNHYHSLQNLLRKPSLIAEAIKKFESTIKFRDLSAAITYSIETLTSLPLVSREDEKDA